MNNFSFAQSDSSKVEISGDLVSRYIWRGADYGNAPAIQPTIKWNWKNLEIGAWGSFGISQYSFAETDLYISYTYKKRVKITATDYFVSFSKEETPNYFSYNQDGTAHVFEGSVTFLGPEKVPVDLLIGMNLYGADARRYHENGDENGIQYSTYVELLYEYKNCEFFIGGNLTDPKEEFHESGYYGEYIGVINIGVKATKEIKVTDHFSLPAFVTLAANPQTQKIFMVMGISL
ncbi:MAG: hypothetical protein A2W91_10210 [Bacteroidetes bacterium GWF2_38_335]|nr:MAG: hypothetical protein A2W91_10210 [Bacteroidetes bacterium GWF2_38_335]HBS88002.1 hypothetical protein [Bacteroidales bacterium]